MTKPIMTAQELKAMIAAAMEARGLPIAVDNVLILHRSHRWSAGMRRAGKSADRDRLAAMDEVGRGLSRTYRYTAARGLSRNSAPAYA